VANGYCFKLIPLEFYQRELQDFGTPEILRSSLDKLILKIKILDDEANSPDISDQKQILKSEDEKVGLKAETQ